METAIRNEFKQWLRTWQNSEFKSDEMNTFRRGILCGLSEMAIRNDLIDLGAEISEYSSKYLSRY